MSSDIPTWYVAAGGESPKGPFTAKQIVDGYRSRRLDATMLCWREGMPQWLPLAQVEPFAVAIRPAIVGRNAPPRATRSPSLPKGIPPLPIPTVKRRTPYNVPLTAACVGGTLGLLLIVAALLMLTPIASREVSGDGREAAALAEIIADYATRLKAAYNSPQTDIQRQEAVAAAVEEFKARVGKCGSVAFTGKVAEIIPEGPKYGGSFRWETRDRWGITMSLPQEVETVVRDGACTFGSKVWVELKKKDALSIQKGDPITVRGAVSYIQGSVLLASDCVDMQVWPNSEQSVVKGLGLGNLGSPHTIAVPVSGSVTCSVGRFKSLRVHTYLGE